ncbi:MAG: hypothetical protein ABJC36_08095 [Gemmatimonadales bacterium]
MTAFAQGRRSLFVAAAVAAIALTVAKPDELERYRPIFHLNAAWMLVLDLAMLRAGLGAA